MTTEMAAPEREVAYRLDATLDEAVLAGTIRLDARGRRSVTALLEGTGWQLVPAGGQPNKDPGPIPADQPL